MRSLSSTARRAPSRPLVIQPLHGGYDGARAAWNLAADLRPAGVVHARSVADVRDAVTFARDLGLRVAPQTTGHLATALPPLDDALLVKTDLGREVQVDPAGLSARVSAGAEWEDVVLAAAEHGLACMHGSSPNVGVVGYLLGGGLSFYARRHGLASDHVLAIELVTADGVLRRVDRDHEPDLFWALRGGGGNFGVVTAVEVGLLPYDDVFSGTTFWPAAEAATVLEAWRAWTETAPDTVTTSARILRLPPRPEIPEFLRGGPVLAIDGVVVPECEDPQAVLAPWRSVGRPLADTWAAGPPAQVLRMHGDPEPPMPGLSDHALLGALDEAGIEAFLGAVGESSGTSLVVAELRQLGGALAAPRPGGGARAHLDGAFALFAVGVAMPPEAGAHVEAHLALLRDAIARYDTGRVHLNHHERGGSARTSFTPEAYARLAAVRAAYDPAELFVASHRIAPAREA